MIKLFVCRAEPSGVINSPAFTDRQVSNKRLKRINDCNHLRTLLSIFALQFTMTCTLVCGIAILSLVIFTFFQILCYSLSVFALFDAPSTSICRQHCLIGTDMDPKFLSGLVKIQIMRIGIIYIGRNWDLPICPVKTKIRITHKSFLQCFHT